MAMNHLDIKKIYEWPKIPKAIVFGAVFLTALCAGYIFDLSSLNGELAEARNKEQTLKQQLEHDMQKEMMLKKDISRYPAIDAALSAWQKKLVQADKVPELLNEILKIGATNHIYFSLFNPGEKKKTGLYTEVPIKVLAVGGYHQLGNFISQIASLPTLVVIGDFSISNEIRNDVLGEKLARQAAAQGLLVGELTLEIYYVSV